MVNKKYLEELRKVYKSADCTEKGLSKIGIEIVDGSTTDKIFSLTECYIGLELGYKKKIPEKMSDSIYGWLNGLAKTKDFMNIIYEIDSEYHDNPKGWDMVELGV